MRVTADVVLDASAALELLLVSARGATVDRTLGPDPMIHVPELFAVEVTAALRGLERRGALSAARATQAIEDLARLPTIRWAHAPQLIARTWELRGNLSTYDAVYVALAERLDATLVTCDRGCAAAARAHARCEVAEHP